MDGLIDAAASAASPDYVMAHARLGQQILVSHVDVAGPCLGHHLVCLLGRELVEARTTALTKAAVIQSEHVDSGCGEAFSEAGPHLALLVALMEEQDSGTWFRSSEIRRFQSGTIGRSQAYGPHRRHRICCTGQHK